jgi:hypothetical protein
LAILDPAAQRGCRWIARGLPEVERSRALKVRGGRRGGKRILIALDPGNDLDDAPAERGRHLASSFGDWKMEDVAGWLCTK